MEKFNPEIDKVTFSRIVSRIQKRERKRIAEIVADIIGFYKDQEGGSEDDWGLG